MPSDNQVPEPKMVTIDAEVLKRLTTYSWQLYAETVSPGQLKYMGYISPRAIYNDLRLAQVALGAAALCPTCGHPAGTNGHSLMGEDFARALEAAGYSMPLPEKVAQVRKESRWGIFR